MGWESSPTWFTMLYIRTCDFVRAFLLSSLKLNNDIYPLFESRDFRLFPSGYCGTCVLGPKISMTSVNFFSMGRFYKANWFLLRKIRLISELVLVTGWKGTEGDYLEGFHFWYWEMDREDFFLLNESLALFLYSSFLLEFLLSKYKVAGVCLFLVDIFGI